MGKIRVGILGATGFTGEKLVELLLSHSNVEITYLCSQTPKEIFYYQLFPKFAKKINIKCEPLNIDKAVKKADVFFLSLPHTISMKFAPYLLKKKKRVIDLSADYRLKDASLYKQYYGVSHCDKKNLKKAIYGLAELFKDKIREGELIANAGCYSTSVITALFPLLADGIIDNVVYIDAKSAVTGAGRKANINFHYTNVSNNIWAYKPFIHQHIPEMVEVLKKKTGRLIKIKFVPHIASIEAGIYSTIFLSFKRKVTVEEIDKTYRKYYKDCPFIRIQKGLPKLKDVIGSNFCDIGFALEQRGRSGVVVSCLDNLIKGAAGSAIQNLNIMQGWPESEGLL
jgi:N-acetyl-gamma-glutamyl-phosphate reductase